MVKEANVLLVSSRARQRRRQERSNSVGAVPAASQNAPVSRQDLPSSIGRLVDCDVVSGSHGNGDARRQSDAANRNVKVAVRKAVASVICPSSGDAKTAALESGRRAHCIHSSVRQLSYLLQVMTILLLFTMQCTLVQSAVLQPHVVRLSVRL